MKRFCVNCGTEIETDFCPNCGTKSGESQPNNEVNEYIKQKIEDKKNHKTYRLVSGIIMIILGAILLVASANGEQTNVYKLAGYNLSLVFVIPGVLSLVSGTLSVLSRNKNELLLASAVLYFVSAIVNMIGISDISILFIVSIIFGIVNIVFYKKAR